MYYFQASSCFCTGKLAISHAEIKNKQLSTLGDCTISHSIFKSASIVFTILCGIVALLFAVSHILESTANGANNFALWTLMLLLQPAIMIRRWFFEIPGTELSYHYYGVMGIFDYLGLAIFYYLVCCAAVWLWTIVKRILFAGPN